MTRLKTRSSSPTEFKTHSFAPGSVFPSCPLLLFLAVLANFVYLRPLSQSSSVTELPLNLGQITNLEQGGRTPRKPHVARGPPVPQPSCFSLFWASLPLSCRSRDWEHSFLHEGSIQVLLHRRAVPSQPTCGSAFPNGKDNTDPQLLALPSQEPHTGLSALHMILATALWSRNIIISSFPRKQLRATGMATVPTHTCLRSTQVLSYMAVSPP